MKLHRNGKTTPHMRALLVQRIGQEHWTAAGAGQEDRFGEELLHHFLTPCSDGFPYATFARALGHRDHHDRHDADSAYHERN